MNIKKISQFKCLNFSLFLFVSLFFIINKNCIMAMEKYPSATTTSYSKSKYFSLKLDNDIKQTVSLQDMNHQVKSGEYYDVLKNIKNIIGSQLNLQNSFFIDELKEKYSEIKINFFIQIYFWELLMFLQDKNFLQTSNFSFGKKIESFVNINLLNDLEKVKLNDLEEYKLKNKKEILIHRFVYDFAKGDISSEIDSRINAKNLLEVFITDLEIKNQNNQLFLFLTFKTYSYTENIKFYFNIGFNVEEISFL
ncbi:hypothetical protein AXA84_0240 [Candidatus Phytoplasma oryzae]|uniref:Uncharacterized protein n=1 Tax=Candidatus Phytoplasma oryzae TaxID=203274 RepID=A0A139JQK6_9MOLU|nr:hypothetical protein [Candidatus Phytoplasma oryzae]KXT29252.1 hypothetical protein AXA84_0240 [Candidatus Phytoplasma oryzae]